MAGKSLKAEYAKWLWALALADLAAVLLFLVPGVPSGASLTELGNWKLLTTVVIPIVVLLVVNVLPHSVKAMLVYWKPLGWLPGSEAFTRYGPMDARVSMQALRQKHGELPKEPKDQNTKWYQIYKPVQDEPEIAESQKHYLMYRDMAVFSLPFIAVAPICLYHAGASPGAQWIGAAIFFGQYLLAAVSACNSGIRFVTNVLAVQSAR
jgi:hypothetical protein